MDALFDSPVPILVTALLVASILAVLYLNSRDRRVLVGMGVLAVIVAGGIALERSVKTDRELIAETLDQLAAALRADGLPENTPETVIPAVESVIAPWAERTRRLVRANLTRAEITAVRYSSLRVEVNRQTIPPIAEVRFDAKISGHGRPPLDTMVEHRSYPLEFLLEMRYENGRWVIGDRLRWKLKTLGNNGEPGRFGFDTGDWEGR